jgi:hypothetical protein
MTKVVEEVPPEQESSNFPTHSFVTKAKATEHQSLKREFSPVNSVGGDQSPKAKSPAKISNQSEKSPSRRDVPQFTYG